MLFNTQTKQQYVLVEPFPVDFPVPFPYWKKADIKAVLTGAAGDAELAEDIDYTLSAPDGESGTLHRISPWNGGMRLTLYRDVPETQEVDLVAGDRLDPELIETMADRSVALIQQIEEKVDRVAQFPVTDPPGAAPVLPSREARAMRFLAFDENGDPQAVPGSAGGVPVSDFMKTVLDTENAGEAKEVLEVAPFLPTAAEKAALAGTAENPGPDNKFVTDQDPRLSNWGSGIIGENIGANDAICIGPDTLLYRASNDDSERQLVLGFAMSAAEYTEGDETPLTFVRRGSLSGFVSLSPGQRYYLGTDGGIVLSEDVPDGAAHIMVGYSLSETELDINVGDATLTIRDLHLEGVPTAPTAEPETNSDQIATTAFVKNAGGQVVGTLYIQYPNSPNPSEAGFAGQWEIWSSRADLYGLSTNQLSSTTNYYSLVGTSINANATPIVYYHKAGNDWRLYKFIAQTAAYTVPAELDPVKWTYQAPNQIVQRSYLQDWQDEDFAIGHLLLSGDYSGKYVTEIIVPGGKFLGVEGGFRPPYISGGVQGGRILNITGRTGAAQPTIFGRSDIGGFKPDPTGPFYPNTSEVVKTPQYDYVDVAALHLNISRVVPTGPDNAPQNLSTRLWRRVA
jgi:hypothetical protein